MLPLRYARAGGSRHLAVAGGSGGDDDARSVVCAGLAGADNLVHGRRQVAARDYIPVLAVWFSGQYDAVPIGASALA